jgi:hypothetical protein
VDVKTWRSLVSTAERHFVLAAGVGRPGNCSSGKALAEIIQLSQDRFFIAFGVVPKLFLDARRSITDRAPS